MLWGFKRTCFYNVIPAFYLVMNKIRHLEVNWVKRQNSTCQIAWIDLQPEIKSDDVEHHGRVILKQVPRKTSLT